MKKKESAFASALFIYMTAVVVLITLLPLNFHMPARYQINWSFDASDMGTNLILFLPVGFLFRLSRSRKADPFCIKTLGFGMLLSSAIEFAQFFVPGRFTQISDVLTNSLGSLLGGIIFEFFKERAKENEAIRLLTLELPLMNLAHLLIPLMWLNGLANGGEGSRLWLLLSLGLCGGGVLASVYVHRLKETGTLTPNQWSLVTASWFIIASLPTLAYFPLEVAGFTILVAVISLFVFYNCLRSAGHRVEPGSLVRGLRVFWKKSRPGRPLLEGEFLCLASLGPPRCLGSGRLSFAP
jgi:glycopeptide antibiotics resistance protein